MQEVEESTTLEDLCQNVSTVSKGCIISLPSQSPIYSRMESLSRRTGAAGRVSPSPSPPKAASPTPIAMGTHNATATPSHKGIGRNGMGSGPTSNPPTPPQAVAQPGLEEGDSEGLSGALNPTADAPDVPASLSAWGLVPMRPVQRSLQELLAQVSPALLKLLCILYAIPINLYPTNMRIVQSNSSKMPITAAHCFILAEYWSQAPDLLGLLQYL